ncbi:MAG: hypothetical protein KAJ19_02735 [Gammaproteobacteria bacterium]|nr:hypothetical protein [Gammaproteobacteria bacterium]
MSIGHKINVENVLMPLANVEYSHDFPEDVERIRIQLRDATKLLHISPKSGDVGISYLITASVLAIGSTKPNVANGACTVFIGGVRASIAAVAAGTALSGDDVPQDKYGAWAIDVTAGDAKSITPAADNVTGYDTAAEAIAGIPAVAKDKARLGVVTAISDTGVFNPGTTNLDAAAVTDTYTDADLKTEVDHPFVELKAAGVWNEDDIYDLNTRIIYFSSPTADQNLEIMYFTGRKREH